MTTKLLSKITKLLTVTLTKLPIKNYYRGVVVIIFIHHIDIPKESVKQHRKRECLKCAVSKVKAYLLGGKQKLTQKRVGKSRGKVVNKRYAEYKQCELNEKVEKMGRVLRKHVNSLYSTRIPQGSLNKW